MKRPAAWMSLLFGTALGFSFPAFAEEIPDPPYAEQSEDLTPVKEAWTALKDLQPDLAARLELIVSGDRTEAGAALVEAASILVATQPELAAQLDELATRWAAE